MENTLAPARWSQAIGNYRERPPAKMLQAHVRCLWFHYLPPGEHAAVEVVPDGCIDLLWLRHLPI